MTVTREIHRVLLFFLLRNSRVTTRSYTERNGNRRNINEPGGKQCTIKSYVIVGAHKYVRFYVQSCSGSKHYGATSLFTCRSESRRPNCPGLL